MRFGKSLLLVAVLTVAGAANADLPPPDGVKFVSFAFEVQNTSAFPDHVLLAYPCSTSSGAPVAAHVVIREGVQVKVGRRGGNCRLYSMKKVTYDEWAKGYTKTEGIDDPALEALFKGDKVLECSTSPNITLSLPRTDPRDTVTESLRVEQLDDTTCRVTSTKGGPAARATAPTVQPAATAQANPATPVAANPSPDTEAPAKTPEAKTGGCAGCAVPTSTDTDTLGWLSVLLLGVGLRRRRRAVGE